MQHYAGLDIVASEICKGGSSDFEQDSTNAAIVLLHQYTMNHERCVI